MENVEWSRRALKAIYESKYPITADDVEYLKDCLKDNKYVKVGYLPGVQGKFILRAGKICYSKVINPYISILDGQYYESSMICDECDGSIYPSWELHYHSFTGQYFHKRCYNKLIGERNENNK